MNCKPPLKIALDFIMIIIYLLLLNPFDTGLVFHEIAGLLAITLFILHILANLTWVKNIFKFQFGGKSAKKLLFMFLINIGLFLCVSTIAITGILISQVLFPAVSNGNSDFLVTVHKVVSYCCLVIISIHVLWHRKYLSASLGNMLANDERKFVLTLGIGLIMGIIFDRNILGSNKWSSNPSNPPTVSMRNSLNLPNKNNTNRGDSPNSNQAFENTQELNRPSLFDYLGNLFCTGCNKHCPLISPGCNKGEAQMQAAKTEYQNLYGQTSSNTTIDQGNEYNSNNNNSNNDGYKIPNPQEENHHRNNGQFNDRTFQKHHHSGYHKTGFRA
ncbi:DUF4405 domain-containing protein [Desulfosporosinus sp. FKA]|uniref:DUF4405 domain-containing protein n=1 Tax=Desulfosporosinus sp. FKA TaxID=1969834 RepID=UPI000B4A474A|nr:DUF4405 domain-containing protein [Desulfosporosinus sp. FKA]